VLSHSRHQYAELVFDQTVATWLRLHRAAFEFFGGVPRRVVLDNLRAAIVHAALYDPEVQRATGVRWYYGFSSPPAGRPSTKAGRAGGVHYVKRNALPGDRNFTTATAICPLVCRTAGRRPPRSRSPWIFDRWSAALLPCPHPGS
jgi:transposase